MGIGGELVRNVFSRSKSSGVHDSNVRNKAMERRRWSSVRSYFCGDDANSVIAEEDSVSVKSLQATTSSAIVEEDSISVRRSKLTISSVCVEQDSASIRGSEATVTQPILSDLDQDGEAQSNERKDEIKEESRHSVSNLFHKDDAAVVIQSACRSFLAKRRNERLNSMPGEDKLIVPTGSPSRESIGTSVEVQTGNSEIFVFQEQGSSFPSRLHNKGARAQASKLKEDWDHSTVSSNISKMRIQHKMEAMTRRERALAYAFAQQLRIGSKKKQTKSGGSPEPDLGWSWLERWMATRQQESSLVDISKQIEQMNNNQKGMARKRLLIEFAGEEKESCGSNQVSLQLDVAPVSSQIAQNSSSRPPRNRLKAASVSRRKTSPNNLYSKEHNKVCKKDRMQDEEDGKQKPKMTVEMKEEIKCEDAASQVSTETSNEPKSVN